MMDSEHHCLPQNGFMRVGHTDTLPVRMILKPVQPLSLRYVDMPLAKEDPQYYNQIISATKNTCFEPIFAKWSSFREMELDSKCSFELECLDAMRKEYGNWTQIYEPKPRWTDSPSLNCDRDFRTNTTFRIHRLLEKLSQVKAKHITEIERRKLLDRHN
jgi:hypothetical protein